LINEIDWENSIVSVETKVESIKGSPEYDPTHLINVVDRDSLREHYEELPSL
jgi:hypothetical protein